MNFEWDEAKSRANRAKHGIPLDFVPLAFEGPLLARRNDRRGEEPWLAIGAVEGLVIAFANRNAAPIFGSSRPGGRIGMSGRTISKSRARAVVDRLRGRTDETIDYSDIPPLGDDFFRTAEWLMPTGKSEVSLRTR